MRIGYACINTRLECRSSSSLRLASPHPEQRLRTVESNLDCLCQVLAFNRDKGLLMLRISSDLAPLASDDAPRRCDLAPRFRQIGEFVRQNGMRVSMHPDQFTMLNAQDESILSRSIAELKYHADVLDNLGLDQSHKIQIHVGAIHGDKAASIGRFIEQYGTLPESVRARLVIENDDRFFDLSDCLAIQRQTGVPVVFDTLHHALNNDGTTLREGISRALATWPTGHGPLMVDYSTQDPGQRAGRRALSIDAADFRRFLEKTSGLDFDVLCEIKDKEASALKALSTARHLGRA